VVMEFIDAAAEESGEEGEGEEDWGDDADIVSDDDDQFLDDYCHGSTVNYARLHNAFAADQAGTERLAERLIREEPPRHEARPRWRDARMSQAPVPVARPHRPRPHQPRPHKPLSEKLCSLFGSPLDDLKTAAPKARADPRERPARPAPQPRPRAAAAVAEVAMAARAAARQRGSGRQLLGPAAAAPLASPPAARSAVGQPAGSCRHGFTPSSPAPLAKLAPKPAAAASLAAPSAYRIKKKAGALPRPSSKPLEAPKRKPPGTPRRQPDPKRVARKLPVPFFA